MSEVTWKRTRGGMLEAYATVGAENRWIGIVNGPMWALNESPLRCDIEVSEEAAKLALARAYKEGPTVRYPKLESA